MEVKEWSLVAVLKRLENKKEKGTCERVSPPHPHILCIGRGTPFLSPTGQNK
jgi:hypothetical protein